MGRVARWAPLAGPLVLLGGPALAGLLALLGSPALAAPQGAASSWRRASDLGALQQRIERLLPGETLELPPGVHEGPIAIRTPHVAIVGGRGAVVDGRGQGTVISIEAPGVRLEGFAVRGSGDSNTRQDAGVGVHGQRDVTLRGLHVSDALFGIDVGDSEDVLIEGCEISSRTADVTTRGDAIRIWASRRIEVRDNYWHDARDAVTWYSEAVVFERNRGVRSRYSVHSMYSDNLTIRENYFEDNSVGIFLMYGNGVTVLDNEIRKSTGAAGIGLGMKESSNVYAEGNAILHCATGIVVDNSPWEPGTKGWFHDNMLAFNGTGILLANDRSGNQFVRNVLRSNATDVDTEGRRTSPSLWTSNHWDRYEGFDRDGDGVGDTPHEPRKYGDLLVGAHPSARFFNGAPVLTTVGIIERLVPLTEPLLVLRDPQPRLDAPTRRFGLPEEAR
ncbi:MAG: nitrous oxide reductase family maturation protein NosD [Myxococcota bacterium]|nr:nitrous oxide reductase family maturation protein NosD [Myxococcota bacterium]